MPRLGLASLDRLSAVTGGYLSSYDLPLIANTAPLIVAIGGPMYGGKPHYEHHFAALRRMLDRREPDYRE